MYGFRIGNDCLRATIVGDDEVYRHGKTSFVDTSIWMAQGSLCQKDRLLAAEYGFGSVAQPHQRVA